MRLKNFRTWEIICLVAILAVGAFLRLYRLPETLMFRGDQGRDAIVAKRILKNRDLALIGPVTSVGNMYLGPLYYYVMVPFLAISYPDPVGPAYGVALLGIITILIIFIVGKKLFNRQTGLIAALLYGTMTYAVIYNRFSWNPNIAPLISILLFYSLALWWQKRSILHTVLSWGLSGLLIQTHYVSLTTVGLLAVIMAANLVIRREYLKTLTLGFIGIFTLGLTQLPLFVFNLRHDNLILNSFRSFFTSPEEHIQPVSIAIHFQKLLSKSYYLISQLFHYQGESLIDPVLTYSSLFIAASVIYLMRKRKEQVVYISLILGWILTTIVGISLYSHTVFAHYLSYSFPIIALYWAFLISELLRYPLSRIGGIAVMLLLLWFNLNGLIKLSWNGKGTSITEQTVKQTLPLLEYPYNIALLSDDHDYKGMVYRYFFEVSGHPPQEPDNFSDLNTLVIIDEVNTESPRLVPIYEIQSGREFRESNIIQVPDGPRVFVLKRE